MLRNDLRGYVLLGDPAVRLPLRKNALHLVEDSHALAPSEVRSTPVATPAAAAAGAAFVLATLRGDEAPRAIAARAGVPLETLWEWVDAYRAERRAPRDP
jgi:hypothetical protein